jgi:anaerobic selenocysteine-containing dehydrogenase
MQLLAEAMGLKEDFFRQSEEELVERLMASTETAWPLPVDKVRLAAAEPVALDLPESYKLDFKTPSGKIEILNHNLSPALPDFFPPHMSEDEGEFILINSPDPRILDSSFNEREELVRGNVMTLLLNPADASRHGFREGDRVTAKNRLGEAGFTLKISPSVQEGTVVSEGVWWQEYTQKGNTNRLTSARTTDMGEGSTFYDVRVDLISG